MDDAVRAGAPPATWTRKLARARVPLGFVCGAIVLWLARPDPGLLMAGLPIAVLGEALRVWAAGHLEKSREVTQSGPYRFMRHPLYAGSALMGIGLSIASASLFVAVLTGALPVHDDSRGGEDGRSVPAIGVRRRLRRLQPGPHADQPVRR